MELSLNINSNEVPIRLKGYRFGITILLKGSQIDRKFSFGNLKKVFEENIKLLQEQAKGEQSYVSKEKEQAIREPQVQQEQPPKGQSKTENKSKVHTIGGVELTPGQWQTLEEGGFIYLENINKRDSKERFSSYVFLNDEKDKAFSCKKNPDTFVKYGKYEMRIRDKILIESGHITKAKVKWYDGEFAYPYLWKENKEDTEYKEAWDDLKVIKNEKDNKQQKQMQDILQNKNKKNRFRL